jgi:hypothetical protein
MNGNNPMRWIVVFEEVADVTKSLMKLRHKSDL